MKRLFIVSIALLALVDSAVALYAAESETFTGVASASGTHTRPGSFNVNDFGAKGDGVADDTVAIQSAINAATKSAAGGTIVFPKGTYLLNSAYPIRHPWAFHNLLVESNVTLLGETGAKLLQGPKGRRPLPEGAEGVRNSVLAFGADHETIRFQNPAFNGGFLSLQATRASSTKVALKTPSESSKFLPGDYVAIYETTSGDVIPTETGQITSVNTSTGELGLKEPLSRSFQTPSIANVTKLATTNIGIKNLIVEGSEPLTVTEAFGFTAEDCRFINDTSIAGGNVIDYNMNTLNGFRFLRNEFTSVGPGYAVMEMTQRNSRHGVWDSNTFDIIQGGMGEYAADIQFTNNKFRLHPNDRTNVGLMIGGKDIVFCRNTLSGGNITSGEGWGCILADCVGPGYERYVGNIKIADNTFDCQADGNSCVNLAAQDTSFTGNTLNVKGSALGIRAEGPLPQSLTIKNNTLSMGTGTGIMIASPRVDGSTVTGNKITGSGAHAIYVASPERANTGKHVISGNTVTGYRTALFIELVLHPGTVLEGKELSPAESQTFRGVLSASGTAQTTPTVTSSVVTVSNRKYTVYDYADPATKRFCVVIPEDLKAVRGLLVECNYAGGDSRSDWTFCTYYREFMHLHDFAIVASAGDIPHAKAFQAFRNCLRRVSVASKHPELVNAPYVAVGFSAGGGFASTLMTRDPERTIAAGIIEARYNFTAFLPPNPPPKSALLDAVLAIPSVLITGGKDNPDSQTGVTQMVDDVFVPFRPKGAEYAWMVLPGYGHEYADNRQDLLIMPLLDLAVRTRYPKDGDVTKGRIKLLSIDPATGWVAVNTTWKSGLTKIVPANQFKGDLGHSSWLQNEDIAFIYRAYATHNNPLTITSPSPCGPGTPTADPGSNVPITVDASKFPNWIKLEFYDGAKKLGTVTAAPAQYTATNLTPGYHVFSVLGADAKGNIRTSDPVLIVVRKF
jgi:hypothetical protein